MADKLGVSRRTVIYWEKGKRAPGNEMRKKLSHLVASTSFENSFSQAEQEQAEQEQLIVTPAEYFEAAYRDADGYIVLCTITQPTTETERGRLYVQGTYSTDSIPELLSDVNELNGQYHIYTNIHPLRAREASSKSTTTARAW